MDKMTSNQYNDLGDFLAKHNAKNIKGEKKITNTRIGNKELNIYAGAYTIDPDEIKTFHRLYYEHVFVKNRSEYLTEKQLDGNGPILIDLDFRYDYSVTTRQHTDGHIQDLVHIYLEELKNIFSFENHKAFPIFIMEKPNVNRVVDKEVTKDGIHIIIGIQMNHILQMMLREKVLLQMSDVFDLPLTNSWEQVLDDGISKGSTNWQMYGSKKPGNEAYALSYYLTAEYDVDEDSWITTAKSIKEIDLLNDYYLLSAQCDSHVKFNIHPDIQEEYERRLQTKTTKIKKSSSRGKINLILEEETNTTFRLDEITNASILKKAVDSMLSQLKDNEHEIREIHEYTQILPKKYYEPGSHLINRKVAFALKHTDDRLFISWVMLRSKAEDFDYASIPSLYHEWCNNFNKRESGITKASIMFWAKEDSYEEYKKIKDTTIDHFVTETIKNFKEVGDWDYAKILYNIFKDKYVCVSINNKKWYVFKNHRWEMDEGQTLRLAISTELFKLYSDKQSKYLNQITECLCENEKIPIQDLARNTTNICLKLKKTTDKNNIIREAMEIFFDKEFTKNIDSNPYLLGFKNGVFDFKTKEFRDGYPSDYISKSTNINYIPYCPNSMKETTDEINDFMDKLFPQKELCKYMWDHLASVLIGIKKEHVFNIYRGSGSNGKSILSDLMSQSLGQYKGTVPINLVTDKRSTIGGATPEIMQLKAIRYAVMQEPSKDAVINEGILKELTGGDPLLGRALFCDSEIFIPQFSLVVCTNSLFEIKSNDDGTWRRMKLVDFQSKFISEGEIHTDTTQYVFPKDKDLKTKLPIWAPVFMSLLINRACQTDGDVMDCPQVVAASNKYRQSQDSISEFINEKIVAVDERNIPNGYNGIKSIRLYDEFKKWSRSENERRKIPKRSELEESIVKKFGNKTTGGAWRNFDILDEEYSLEDLK